MSALRIPLRVLLVALSAASLSHAAPSKLAPEIGYHYGEQETPRSAAMGGALRALSNSTDAAFLNPANLAATRVYHLAGVGQIWPQAARQSYGGAAVDSIVNKQGIAGGVSGVWTRQDADGVDRTSFDFRFALAAPLGDKLLIGGGLRYMTLQEEGFPRTDAGLRPSITSAGLPESDIVHDITFDAGLTLKPVPELSISFVGNNLTDPGHGFLPMMLGGGVGLGTKDFSIEGDVVADYTTYNGTKVRAMGGAEVLIDQQVPLRAGYQFDQAQRSHSASGGIGYVTREYGLDATFRSTLKGERVYTFVLGLKYHLDGAGLVR